MLKLLTLMALCASFAVSTACTAKKQPSKQATATTSPAPTATQAAAEATHPDLVINDVHGAVKKIDYYDNEEWIDEGSASTCTFTQAGAYATIGDMSFEDYYNKGFKRDEHGRLTYLNHEAPESDDIEIVNYTYNAQGLPQTIKSETPWGTMSCTFTYNDQGEIIKEEVKGEDVEEGSYEFTNTYKILTRDDHGNWTRRQATSSEGDSWVNKRVITYWP